MEISTCCLRQLEVAKNSYKQLELQGVPKRMLLLSGFEFLTLGGVFLGVKNNSKNFLFYKIFWLSMQNFEILAIFQFFINKVHLLKILLNNLIFFLFPEFLELFFTPKNTPPKVKNSKPDNITIFFGTPCSRFQTDLTF